MYCASTSTRMLLVTASEVEFDLGSDIANRSDDCYIEMEAINRKARKTWEVVLTGNLRKLDAIDTDQITPATDCVSVTLETLVEGRKSGAFRTFLLHFHDRVHRGE